MISATTQDAQRRHGAKSGRTVIMGGPDKPGHDAI